MLLKSLSMALSLCAISCAPPTFNSSAPRNPTPKPPKAGNEGLQADQTTSKSSDSTLKTSKSSDSTPQTNSSSSVESLGSAPPNKIAAPGLSLDLHAIIDVSGSLGQNDPNCTRIEALKAFFGDLRKTLGTNPEARLSLTIFSSSATFVGTDDGFLQLSDVEFDAKYRQYICKANGNTNISQAFNVARQNAVNLIQSSPKKVASVLIFTDGYPTDMPLPINAAAELRTVFPDRVFGILLGAAGMTSGSGNPEAFMTQVTASAERVRRVSQVNDLATALSSFIK
ncbi:MAG: vWA domain-containing protein [Silvanigrellaceae bacterium]